MRISVALCEESMSSPITGPIDRTPHHDPIVLEFMDSLLTSEMENFMKCCFEDMRI